ncbi:MAG: glycosyltransferase family 39 protein [Terriglobales bacterium]
MKNPRKPRAPTLPERGSARTDDQEKVVGQSVAAAATPFARNYGEWVALAVLAIVMTAQMWSSIRRLSVTSDEVVHLGGGYRFLQCGDSSVDPEHPPLVKIVAALPLMALHVNDPNPAVCGIQADMESSYRRGHDFLFANDESMLTMSRVSTSIFAVLLLGTTYFFARALFGTTVAMIAGVWVAFEPNFLGHGSLVTTDVPAALGFVAAVYALWTYLNRRTGMRFLVLGLGLGVALATKYSTVLLLGILPILIIVDGIVGEKRRRDRRILGDLGAFLLALLVAVAFLWAIYGFHFASPTKQAALSPPTAQGTLERIISEVGRTHLLPEAYLTGLQDLTLDSGVGRRAFLLGKNYLGGRWYYFPVVLSLKLSVALILGLLLSIVAFHFWRSNVRELFFLVVPALLYLTVSARSGMNLGVRYVLPVIPFLLVFAAAGIWNLQWTRKTVIIVVSALLAMHTISSLRTFPNYISYGNELWGGPENVYKYLADSNADWGQALKMAHNYVERAKPASCLMIPTYRNVDKDYNIACPDLISEIDRGAASSHYTGTLLVSSSVVDGIIFRSGGARAMRIFRGVEPSARLGGSAILVYHGSFDLGPIFSYQYVQRILAGRIRNDSEVLETAKAAAELDPQNSDAWSVICEAEASLGNREAAQSACNSAYHTMSDNPYSTENDRASVIRFMTNNGMMLPQGAVAQSSE